MNDSAGDRANDQPISLINEANPDANVFAGASPSPTDASAGAGADRAASTIVPDAHIQPSGQKQ